MTTKDNRIEVLGITKILIVVVDTQLYAFAKTHRTTNQKNHTLCKLKKNFKITVFLVCSSLSKVTYSKTTGLCQIHGLGRRLVGSWYNSQANAEFFLRALRKLLLKDHQ